jgi:hypothetical protein
MSINAISFAKKIHLTLKMIIFKKNIKMNHYSTSAQAEIWFQNFYQDTSWSTQTIPEGFNNLIWNIGHIPSCNNYWCINFRFADDGLDELVEKYKRNHTMQRSWGTQSFVVFHQKVKLQKIVSKLPRVHHLNRESCLKNEDAMA